jgi:transcriptional regulator with XRE-family HTH domain
MRPSGYAAQPTVAGGDRQISVEHAALGRAIRERRLAVGLSQEELAERSGLHRTYVGGIERGERNVSFGNLLKLARALGVPLSELVGRAEEL